MGEETLRGCHFLDGKSLPDLGDEDPILSFFVLEVEDGNGALLGVEGVEEFGGGGGHVIGGDVRGCDGAGRKEDERDEQGVPDVEQWRFHGDKSAGFAGKGKSKMRGLIGEGKDWLNEVSD